MMALVTLKTPQDILAFYRNGDWETCLGCWSGETPPRYTGIPEASERPLFFCLGSLSLGADGCHSDHVCVRWAESLMMIEGGDDDDDDDDDDGDEWRLFLRLSRKTLAVG